VIKMQGVTKMQQPEMHALHDQHIKGLLEAFVSKRLDWGSLAFIAYDTCNTSTSPVRNCDGGAALFHGVLGSVMKIPVLEDVAFSKTFRDVLREKLPLMMDEHVRYWHTHIQSNYRGKRGEDFMLDVLPNAIGTHYKRDPALSVLRVRWDSVGIGEWGRVRFPIVFHVQWDSKKNPHDSKSKEKMFFHVTFHPWATCTFLAHALASSNPPVQVRETPFKDPHKKCMYQSPRKYVIDWDLFLEENLHGCAPDLVQSFTPAFLARNMFVRALGVLHAYMRQMHTLPSKKALCISIKSRTRKALNKHGKIWITLLSKKHSSLKTFFTENILH